MSICHGLGSVNRFSTKEQAIESACELVKGQYVNVCRYCGDHHLMASDIKVEFCPNAIYKKPSLGVKKDLKIVEKRPGWVVVGVKLTCKNCGCVIKEYDYYKTADYEYFEKLFREGYYEASFDERRIETDITSEIKRQRQNMEPLKEKEQNKLIGPTIPGVIGLIFVIIGIITLNGVSYLLGAFLEGTSYGWFRIDFPHWGDTFEIVSSFIIGFILAPLFIIGLPCWYFFQKADINEKYERKIKELEQNLRDEWNKKW